MGQHTVHGIDRRSFFQQGKSQKNHHAGASVSWDGAWVQGRSHDEQGGTKRRIVSRSTTAGAEFGQGHGLRQFTAFAVRRHEFNSPSCQFFSLFYFVFSELSATATRRRILFLINLWMNDYEINWEPGKTTGSWTTMDHALSFFELISWPVINKVVKIFFLRWVTVAESWQKTKKNEKSVMTGSRTRDVPLRNLEIDAVHGPVRIQPLLSYCEKRYVSLYPLARHENAPGLSGLPIWTDGYCNVLFLSFVFLDIQSVLYLFHAKEDSWLRGSKY